MNSLIIYSLEIAISIVLFYSIYWLFLKNQTFFTLNRFYLVSSVLLSLSLPLLNITVCKDSFITQHFIAPIERFEQDLFGKSAPSKDLVNPVNENLSKKVPVELTDKKYANSKTQTNVINFQGSAVNGQLNWMNIVLWIYLAGVFVFLVRFVANLVWIFSFALKHKSQTIEGMKVVRSERDISPFSFLNLIFIGKKEYLADELRKIISHEKVHIRQRHSFDLILFELLLIIQWFNPFTWFYKKSIRITHEYLADQGTLNSGVDMPDYQYSLLSQVLSENNFEIASNYNLSIKKRIAMMMQKRSSKFSTLRLVVALPVLLLLSCAFAFSAGPSESEKINDVALIQDPGYKEISVPISYLKLLEGEYVSTNEPGRIRRIVFTELMGHLHGFDAGYTYKILPIGGESFINPDDKASLVFDSKDKNAISLLLFGKIILKKQYSTKAVVGVQNKSLAFTAANVMVYKGIPAGLSYFKAAKDSGNYFFTESDLNYAGYSLLQGKKTKESAALFKLNTEFFPESFNTYDSYAEALLELGDKAGAIENYKKSVKLNPGSKSGLEHLKQLGINTEGLVKKVTLSKEYLETLEGDYLSTNEKNWVRWIRLQEADGVLHGTDNGYRYSLIAMGDGKFINPDDGASLIFDTRDKNAINFRLFGTVNMIKVKTPNPVNIDLKRYTGLYLAPAEATNLQPTEVTQNNGKLYRTITTDPPGKNKTIELVPVAENTFFYSDNSGRSLVFIENEKKEITHFLLRRFDGVYRLDKQK